MNFIQIPQMYGKIINIYRIKIDNLKKKSA
jgi:hypothetical protein